MTYDEFQRQLGKAGVTAREFAELVRMNRVSLSNYAKKSEVPSHLAIIAVLIAEMAEKKMDYRSVLKKIEIAPKKPRGAGTGGRFGGNKQSDLDLFTHQSA